MAFSSKFRFALLACVLAAFTFCGEAYADWTVGAGETYTLTAGETLTIDGNLVIGSGGVLDSSAANTNISLSGNWTNNGTFTPGANSTVTFTDNSLTSTITGNNSFYNFTCTTAGKNLTFQAGSTQTMANSLTLNGQATGTKIILRSSINDTRFTLDVTGGSQSVDYVDVKDSQSSTNDITANSSTNSGNNDDAEASPHWVFAGATTLSLQKTVSDNNGGILSAGETLTYSLTLTNAGAVTATNTVITDAIPDNTTYIAGSTTSGGTPQADVGGISPLASGLTVGTLNSGAQAVVTFQVTLNSDVVTGLGISNQASANCDQTTDPELSDDPNVDGNGDGTLTNEDDPTVIVVGTAPVIKALKTVTDVNGGSVAAGDTLHYTVIINNIGNTNAASVVFTDLDGGGGQNLDNATYTAGTIELNDVAKTDAGSDDEADFNVTTANTVTVNIGTFAAGALVKVEFDVTVDALTADGTVISNQGTVAGGNTPDELTDSDGNDSNGNQPATLIVGTLANLNLTKSLDDLNGGTIAPGDTLLYTLVFNNTGSATAPTVIITDTPDSDTALVVGSVTTTAGSVTTGNTGGDTTVSVAAGNVSQGSEVTVTYRVTINAVADGTEITNSASADDTGQPSTPAATDSVTVKVGGSDGVAGVTGRVYLDRDQDDTYDAGEELASWTVVFEDSDGNTYQAAINTQGIYTLRGLPVPQSYTAKFYASNGMKYGRDLNVGALTSGDFAIDQNLLVDPSGYVYDSVTGQSISGVTVELFDVGTGLLVPAGQLAGTANPQTTTVAGFYQFLFLNNTIPPGNTYEVRVTPSAGYTLSGTYPAVTNDVTAGLLTIAAGQIDAPAAGSGNVDDKAAPPFNVVGPNGALYRYAWQIVYGAGEFGEVLRINVPLDPLTSDSFRVTKEANKKEVSVGDIVTYTVTMENLSSINDVSGVYLEDKIPAGFKYISGRAILDNQPISDPTGNRPINFNIGTVAADQTRTLKYQLVVGSGVTFGNYENSVFAKSNGVTVSNIATETVKVVPDPLFDLGTVIGKVFRDRNENGIQDKGEEPVPGVRIVTEDGTVITTGRDGKYHLAGITPGRHLFRLDERTLPNGAYPTTDKVVIADITPGILAKVNFGFKAPDGGRFESGGISIARGRDIPRPRLNVAHYVLGAGRRTADEKGAPGLRPSAADLYEFRIFTNYRLFIEGWSIEIRDKRTKRLVKAFEGTRDNISEPIYWDGKDEGGRPIRADRGYVYRLKVVGAGGSEDVSWQRGLRAASHGHDPQQTGPVEGQRTDEDRGIGYGEWLRKERLINNLDKQTIRVEGETVRVVGSNYQSVRVLKGQRYIAEIPVLETEGLTAKGLLETPGIDALGGQSKTEIIIPRGEYVIEVHGSRPTDRSKRSTEEDSLSTVGNGPSTGGVFRKNITIGDDYLFFVAMGDAKVGYTFNRGNIEPVQQDDKFHKRFWSEGKLAYYLKGKVKGKYLVTSSLDTERDNKELFKNLDPDKYYPIYGDSSSVDYKATDTQGVLYLLIEWDKSSVLWGNYNTALTDTEFAQFSRTLYGGKVDFESASTTKFGDPDTKLIVFSASAQQKAAHNEFTGTGGSLYYLKHKDIIEGSDKVKIAVRDKVTGLVLGTEEMEEGSDYEMDYPNGRITFRESVSSITESSSIISSHLLDGNPVYVVVDYEYDVKEDYDKGTVGVRVRQSISDYVSVGGTYVEEKQSTQTYELKGVDTVIHLGKDVKLTAEYARSESEALGSFISTDGGLSFTELPTAGSSKGEAYGVKGEAHLLSNKLGLSSYYKWLDNDFSTSATSSQQGKELIGFGATLDFTPRTRLTAAHDIQKLIDDGNPQTRLQVGATRTETTSAQLAHEMERLKLTGEYRHQEVREKKDEFESETNAEEDTVAVKADYKLTDKVDVSLEQQATLKGESNHQTTVGIEAEVNDWLSLRGKETVGTRGASTSIGATSGIKDKFEVSGDYTMTNYRAGEAGDRASLGASTKINEKTEVHSTYAVTDSMGEGKAQSLTVGSKRKINDHSEITADRTFATSGDKETSGTTFGLVREKDGRQLKGRFTRQYSEGATEVTNSNIFGLSGDINDRWAASGTFERGIVRNLDGTKTTRHAGSLGLGFVDKDKETGEVKLKASGKIELRFDEGQEDKRQYLLYSAIEGKINPDTTLFAKANLSQTRNTTTDSTEAQYKELVFGTAYRPVEFDRLNLLAKYSYLEDDSPASQSDINDIEEEKAHILAGEAVMDLTDKWQLSEKLAYKTGKEKVTGFDFTKTSTWLWINRLGYNINKDWQVFGEYRVLTQKQAEDRKHGALVEIARNIGDFVQVGAGYNFTEFNDDLTRLDYTSQGPFIRVTGRFYDRTPAEMERTRQKALERKLEDAVKRRVRKRFAKEGSTERERISALYRQANDLYMKGELVRAEEKYNEALLSISRLVTEERTEVDERIEREDEINLLYSRANYLYGSGKLEEALDVYVRCLERIENLK